MSQAARALARGIQANDPVAIEQMLALDEVVRQGESARNILRLVVQSGRDPVLQEQSKQQLYIHWLLSQNDVHLGRVGSGHVGGHVGDHVGSSQNLRHLNVTTDVHNGPEVQQDLHRKIFNNGEHIHPNELARRQSAWNHPAWQAHLRGEMPLDRTNATETLPPGVAPTKAHGKKISDVWLTSGHARGYEKMSPKGEAARSAIGGPQQGSWTPEQLASENGDRLYMAWLTHRGALLDASTQRIVDHVSAHGLAPDDPAVLEGAKRVMPSAESYSQLNEIDRAKVDGKAAKIGVTINQIFHNMEDIRVKGENGFSAEAPHWYEAEFAQTGAIAHDFGIDHAIVAAVAAAHSPMTGWNKNRRMTAMTISAWEENPLISVTQNEVDQHNKIYHQREESYAKAHARFEKTGRQTKAYRDALRARTTLAPSTGGTYHLQEIPAEILGQKLEMSTTVANITRGFRVLHQGGATVMLGNPKIASFYNNIISPHNKEHSTVDSWMLRAGMGDDVFHWPNGDRPMDWRNKNSQDENVVLSDNLPTPETIATGLYPYFREAIRMGAEKHNMTDSSYQAWVWTNVKGFYEGKGEGSVGTTAKKSAADAIAPSRKKAKFARANAAARNKT